MMRALIVSMLMLVGCDKVGMLWNDAEVYSCDVGVELELCWPNGASTLEDQLNTQYGITTTHCERSSRLVAMFGCQYECPPPAHGCNAKMSCYCPTQR